MTPIDPQYPNFTDACHSALQFLQSRCAFDRWLVTRFHHDEWVVVDVASVSNDLPVGTSCPRADSLCDRMAAGLGPRFAPRVAVEESYATAPLRQRVGFAIESYAGVPLLDGDGNVLGSLCAFDSAARTDDGAPDLQLIELVGELLSRMLVAEVGGAKERDRAERAESEAMTDSLTGLYNRRGWERRLHAEESRCKREGRPAGVISVDLDELKLVNDRHGHAAGDDLICRASDTLRAAVREQDVVARLGGDEFAILGVGCENTKSLALGVQVALVRAGIAASVGYAERHPRKGLSRAQHEADATMYHRKRRRRDARMPAHLVRVWPTQRVS